MQTGQGSRLRRRRKLVAAADMSLGSWGQSFLQRVGKIEKHTLILDVDQKPQGNVFPPPETGSLIRLSGVTEHPG